ncbi:hypothetical protein JCM10296v2_004523 [Rhodotorula toruloides]
MLTWCTKKMPSHHNRHYRPLDTHAEHQSRAVHYVPDPEAVAAARRRMHQQREAPALPPAAFRVERREQMPPPPPPKDDHLPWPTRKSSRDALKPPEVDYKRSSTASTWGSDLLRRFQEEAPPLPQEGVIPIIYQHVDEDAERERARRRELRRRDGTPGFEHAAVHPSIAVVGPGTHLKPKLIQISRPRSPPVFKHQQQQH